MDHFNEIETMRSQLPGSRMPPRGCTVPFARSARQLLGSKPVFRHTRGG